MKKQLFPDSLQNALHTSVTEDAELKKISELISQNFTTEKIICFGSMVSNIRKKSIFSLAEEDFIKSDHLNSYCILMVPPADEKRADHLLQQKIEESGKTIANLTVIVHRMEEINLALQNGSSFFTTIYKKGRLLYDNGSVPFSYPSPGRDLNRRILQRETFWHQWHHLASGFLEGAEFYAVNGNNNLALYMLHQSLQHCYAAMLRVLTGYRISSNSLRRLLRLIDNALPDYSFSGGYQHTPEEARLTALLLKGFGDGRYNANLEVTAAEIADLTERVQQIISAANVKCLNRIKNIKEGKIAYVA